LEATFWKQLAQFFSVYQFKNKIVFNFVKLMTTKKGKNKKISPLLPGWEKINHGQIIPDPQH
jgi:hypothetical protein